MSTQTLERFTQERPCPVCGDYEGAPRHRGRRCWGCLLGDGEYAFCTREEHAGSLSLHASGMGFLHRLSAPCKCGVDHGTFLPPAPSTSHPRASRAPEPSGTLSAAYVYWDTDGRPVHRTLRYVNPKDFRQERYEGGTWRRGLRGIQPVLYNLPALLAALAAVPVFLPEGEKDCDRLTELGLVATTNAMGAKSWRTHYGQWLRGRRVVILEDNDEDGRTRTQRLLTFLQPVAASVEVACFPHLPPGGDVSDWLDRGGDVRELLASTLAAV